MDRDCILYALEEKRKEIVAPHNYDVAQMRQVLRPTLYLRPANYPCI